MGGIPLHIGARSQYWGVEIFQYWTRTDLIAVLVVFGETGKSPKKKQYFFSACSVAISPHQMLVVGGVPHDDDIEAHRLTVNNWLIFWLIFGWVCQMTFQCAKRHFRVIEFDSRSGDWSIWGLLSVPYIG